MEVGIVSVGDELLAGDTVNTNAAWLCGQLHERGVAVTRVSVIPDDVEEIGEVVLAERARSDAVLVTGGLGPTHDDLTMEALARALDRPLVEHPEAKRWLAERGYATDELVSGTVALPEGADALHNEVGVAPGAKVDDIYVFPGVPAEMREMFHRVADGFTGDPPVRRTVEIDEPESRLLDRIATVRTRFDVDVGSYPGDTVDIVITGTAEGPVKAAAAWLAERSETISAQDGTHPDECDQEARD